MLEFQLMIKKDNGYSIDSQLRMIKEYCEKKKNMTLLMFIMMPVIQEKI